MERARASRARRLLRDRHRLAGRHLEFREAAPGARHLGRLADLGAGRSCPASYWYGPQALAHGAPLHVDCVWIAGGLYGNPFALRALVALFESERGTKALVFNGDFHWFDADPGEFGHINEAALSFRATRGNVETELAAPTDEAGCGCAYPEWVDDGTVERSNRIVERLRVTARSFPDSLARLAALPMHMRADVGDAKVAIVHGDAESLAGWRFSQEALATVDGQHAARCAFDLASVEVFASSHTCLPVLRTFGEERILINNGAAGMPNFKGQLFGLATRIAVSPSPNAIHRARVRGVFVEAVPLAYDVAAWEKCFLQQWPEGSDAHASYYQRIVSGPAYFPAQAFGAA
jgi:hypothetical protein